MKDIKDAIMDDQNDELAFLSEEDEIDKKLNECFYMTEFIDLFPNKHDRMEIMLQYWMNGVRKDSER